MKISQHENLSYVSFLMKISRSTVCTLSFSVVFAHLCRRTSHSNECAPTNSYL